jgi:hypothetical protein
VGGYTGFVRNSAGSPDIKLARSLYGRKTKRLIVPLGSMIREIQPCALPHVVPLSLLNSSLFLCLCLLLCKCCCHRIHFAQSGSLLVSLRLPAPYRLFLAFSLSLSLPRLLSIPVAGSVHAPLQTPSSSASLSLCKFKLNINRQKHLACLYSRNRSRCW